MFNAREWAAGTLREGAVCPTCHVAAAPARLAASGTVALGAAVAALLSDILRARGTPFPGVGDHRAAWRRRRRRRRWLRLRRSSLPPRRRHSSCEQHDDGRPHTAPVRARTSSMGSCAFRLVGFAEGRGAVSATPRRVKRFTPAAPVPTIRSPPRAAPDTYRIL